tara:strand:- start:1843 stop:2238 length:396 start_codon:yes stop_codon:yes gene_type:complete
MENKYYTPEIEEFHVGFEYEAKPKGSTEVDYSPFTWRGDNSMITEFNSSAIRVKHLDREDVESLGFNALGSGWYQYRHGVMVPYWTKLKVRTWKGNEVIISGWREEEHGILFQGIIKNKSELKKVLKQIGL